MSKENGKSKEQDEQTRRLVLEAEAIAAGGKPGDVTPSPRPGSAGPVAGDPGDGPASPPAPAPMDPGPLAALAVVLGDMIFAGLLGFGEAGRLAEPLRGEAEKAWGDVIRHYAPALQTVGPAGALLTIYGIHFATLTAGQAWAKQTGPAGDSVPGPSDATAPAKQP